MTQLIHLAHLVSAAWAAAGELLTAGAILWGLNTLAAAIQWTWKAGRFCGRLWFAYAVPAILWAADAVSWAIAQIDWAEVRAQLSSAARALLAAAITAGLLIRDAHQRWVGAIDWRPAPAPAAPAINPLFIVADELHALSCRELRSQFGLRQRCSKAKLIAAALAC